MENSQPHKPKPSIPHSNKGFMMTIITFECSYSGEAYGYYGNTGGEMERVILPTTKITVVIPRRKYVLAVRPQKFKDRGVIPDYEVIPGIDDILSNRDVQLEYALKLAEKE